MAERGQEAENRSKRRRRAETRTWMMEGCGLSLAAQGQDWDWGQPFMLGGLFRLRPQGNRLYGARALSWSGPCSLGRRDASDL